MIIKKSRLTFVGAGLTLALTFATASNATTVVEGVRQTTVSYADLDLTRSADTERLYRRLQNAVKAVCVQAGVNALRERLRESNCSRRSMDDAIVHINSQELTKLHILKLKDKGETLLAGK